MAPKKARSAISASTAASTGEDMSMDAPQGTENVSPEALMVTSKLASGKRVRMTKDWLLVVLATLN